VFTARYVLPKLCIFCGSANKQRLFHCTALSGCFYNRDGVFTARYVLPKKCISIFYNRDIVFTARYVLPNKCIYEPLFHCAALSDWFL
jgi:hypothetical protein